MVERFLSQTSFTSQEDFIKNLKINVPENFNFGYDVVDAWAEEQPDKNALLWTNDKGEARQYTFADMKRYSDKTAAYFQSLGIGKTGFSCHMILILRADVIVFRNAVPYGVLHSDFLSLIKERNAAQQNIDRA